MGRTKKRKRKQRDDALVAASSAAAAIADDDDEEHATQPAGALSFTEEDDATILEEGDPPMAALRRRRCRRRRHDDGTTVAFRSSWFPEVTWVGRRRDDVAEDEEEEEVAGGGKPSSVPPHAKEDNDDDAARMAEEDRTASSASASASASKRSTTMPDGGDEDSSLALSELNRIKRRLAPSAEACARAIKMRAAGSREVTTPGYEFRRARSICNPYESLTSPWRGGGGESDGDRRDWRRRRPRSPPPPGGGLSRFVNRSAIKLANIDAMLGFVLTSSPSSRSDGGATTTAGGGDFVFADLCGAPGGFSEYVLHRRAHPPPPPPSSPRGSSTEQRAAANDRARGRCYGFGMSLSGGNADGAGVAWDMDHLRRHHLRPPPAVGRDEDAPADAPGSPSSYRVCRGADGTGSIYIWDNVLELQREMRSTVPGGGDGALADLVVADGGFDAQRDADDQEATAHGIVVCQTAAALALLRPGGTFVLKMFGTRTCGTRRMMRDLYARRFDKLTFVKPISSRPASAERYLVCIGYAGRGPDWDGLVWRGRMMIPVHTPEPPHPRGGAQEGNPSPVEALMDSFDGEMSRLNVDACRAIIDYLDDRRDSVERGDEPSARETRKYCLDRKMYEEAWRLR